MWDGSDIGCLEVHAYETEMQTYLTFTRDGEEFMAEYNIRKEPSLCCLLDELKEVFGLDKIGTCRATIDGKLCLLQRVRLSPRGHPVRYLTVAQCLPDEEKLALVLAFRLMVGIATTISCIRHGNGEILSYDEITITDKKPLKTLSKYVTRDHIIRLSGVTGTDSQSITQGLAQLRSKIERVIHRVDREYIWLADWICRRVQRYI